MATVFRPRWALPLCAAAATACGKGELLAPAAVASVEVMSPIDTLVALGRSDQLVATVRNSAGSAVSEARVSWGTSDPAVAGVSATGLVTAVGTGTATITATVLDASGSLRLRVVAADLAAVSTLAQDAFAGSLVAGLSSAERPAAQAAYAGCASGAIAGNVVAVRNCVAAVRIRAASSTDQTDRALLAVLVLYADQIERSLGL